MDSLFISFAALSALLPVVAARRGGGGSISIGDDGSSLNAPPLQIANLAAHSIFALVTLIQLAKALPHLFRSGVRIPAAGVVVALVIMVVGYALGAGAIVAQYRVGISGPLPIFPYEQFIDLNAAANIFFTWGDPAMFVAVAFVLLNRYRAVQKKVSAATIGFISTASVLVMLMIALAAAKEGIVAATVKAEFRDISFEASDRITTSNNCFFAFVAFHVVSMIFLAVSAFLVKARTKNDKIMSLTLFTIVPLLLIHALALLIFAIIESRLLNHPETESFIIETENAIDFATTLILGLLYVTAMSILVLLLARPPLWGAESLPMQDTTPSRPHTIVQGVPPAQFPGQWGYPQQSQGPHPQQYMYVPVFPAQNPVMFGTPAQPPQSEQTSPQPSSQPSRQLPVPPAPHN